MGSTHELPSKRQPWTKEKFLEKLSRDAPYVFLFGDGIESILDEEDGAAVSAAAGINSKIEELSVREVIMGDNVTALLLEPLRQLPKLWRLDLYNVQLGDESAKTAAKILENSQRMEYLSLARNDITAEGAEHLSHSLRNNTSLRFLDLSFNPRLGNIGAEHLSRCFEANKSLRGLYLEGCDINEQGIRALTAALHKNNTLVDIQVGTSAKKELQYSSQEEEEDSADDSWDYKSPRLHHRMDELSEAIHRRKLTNLRSTPVESSKFASNKSIVPLLFKMKERANHSPEFESIMDAELYFRKAVDWTQILDRNVTSSGPLFQFLTSHMTRARIVAENQQEMRDVNRANKLTRKLRDLKIEALKSKKSEMKNVLLGQELQRLDYLMNSYEEWFWSRNLDMEEEISALVLHHLQTLEEEREVHMHYLRLLDLKYSKQIALSKFIFKLNKFAALLEWETTGRVMLRRLEPKTMHWNNCKMALWKSMKSDYFTDTPYGSIKLLEAFKVDNDILDQLFEGELKKEPKVETKYLFCNTQRANIQWISTFGFHPSLPDNILERLFDTFWSISRNSDEFKTRQLLKEKSSPRLPQAFSVHSTLETDKNNLKDKPYSFHFLFWCRMKTISRPEDLKPQDLRDYDCIYIKRQREYLMLKPAHILPEYLLVYQYNQKSGGTPPSSSPDAMIENENEISRKTAISGMRKISSSVVQEFNDFNKDHTNYLKEEQNTIQQAAALEEKKKKLNARE
ncbi:protein NLRC3-like [Planoprotostelium fungivorum]|uniref:Protein NLRC3-like n=1 Tax=Planoprotostelium fungivorum TaxID=1890364 RepID=A0A2P6N4J0_9EUKA|nr:protein NLRC3-like [Planoprotostelium fungivorum]